MNRSLVDLARFYVNQVTGFDVIRVAGQHTLRSHLTRVIEAYQIESVIDVGANEGQFAISLRNLGFRGRIYSFEPVQGAYEKLAAASSHDNQWLIFDFALGAQSGDATINVSDSSSFSSILGINDYARQRWTASNVTHQQKIQIRTLDECASSGLISCNNRLLLKMDTQGYDLEVFKGAGAVLPNVACILSELSLIPIYYDMPTYVEALTEFESRGFKVSGFYPITRNSDLTLNEVDCVLVKPSTLDR